MKPKHPNTIPHLTCLPTLLAGLAAMLAAESQTPAVAKSEARQISRAVLLDKIRGGWAGQMIGVSFGAASEFRAQGKILDMALPWKPEMVENSIHQDDLYVEMTFAAVMDKLGLNATSKDYGRAFRDSKYGLWHANAGARKALNQGIDAPWSGHPKYNFHANDIDFQIEADFIGLMCPGLPRASNLYCDRVGRVMNYGDGLYGGMFGCGMYSAAFFESDPRKIVEAGLACIPAKSEYGLLIRDLLDWSAKNPDDWQKVWQMVEDKWDKNDACPDGALTPFNIDAKLNGAYIAFGLLYGKGNLAKTMEIATRCGQDSDCNPSSAAGILGVVLGFNRISPEYKSFFPQLENRKFDYTEYSFNDIVKSTEARALKVIEMAGGRFTATEATIPEQTAKAPKLEQWSPGIPVRRVNATDKAWTWTGPWKENQATKLMEGAGGEAVLDFDGVAVAILGSMDQKGGQALVYVDGKKQEFLLDAFVPERTNDNVLWNCYGLKPGRHSVRLVTLDKADARSGGKRVAIHQAIIYQAAK